MTKKSAGILMFRKSSELEVLLVHPGGPFFMKKDHGVWSIPKGEFLEHEDALTAAKREFEEETGHSVDGEFVELKPITQKGGKNVYAWAVEGDIDVNSVKSNLFELEWPPRSRRMQEFPEVDKAAWFTISVARTKIIEKQAALLDELSALRV